MKGAILVLNGHVAYVGDVYSDTSIKILEANFDYEGSIREQTLDLANNDNFLGYIYGPGISPFKTHFTFPNHSCEGWTPGAKDTQSVDQTQADQNTWMVSAQGDDSGADSPNFAKGITASQFVGLEFSARVDGSGSTCSGYAYFRDQNGDWGNKVYFGQVPRDYQYHEYSADLTSLGDMDITQFSVQMTGYASYEHWIFDWVRLVSRYYYWDFQTDQQGWNISQDGMTNDFFDQTWWRIKTTGTAPTIESPYLGNITQAYHEIGIRYSINANSTYQCKVEFDKGDGIWCNPQTRSVAWSTSAQTVKFLIPEAIRGKVKRVRFKLMNNTANQEVLIAVNAIEFIKPNQASVVIALAEDFQNPSEIPPFADQDYIQPESPVFYPDFIDPCYHTGVPFHAGQESFHLKTIEEVQVIPRTRFTEYGGLYATDPEVFEAFPGEDLAIPIFFRTNSQVWKVDNYQFYFANPQGELRATLIVNGLEDPNLGIRTFNDHTAQVVIPELTEEDIGTWNIEAYLADYTCEAKEVFAKRPFVIESGIQTVNITAPDSLDQDLNCQYQAESRSYRLASDTDYAVWQGSEAVVLRDSLIISMTVTLHEPSSHRCLIAKESPDGSELSFKLAYRRDKLRFEIMTQEAGWQVLESSPVIPVNTPFTAKAQYTGFEMRIYLNEELDTQREAQGSIVNSSYPVILGYTGYRPSFIGEIANPAVVVLQ